MGDGLCCGGRVGIEEDGGRPDGAGLWSGEMGWREGVWVGVRCGEGHRMELDYPQYIYTRTCGSIRLYVLRRCDNYSYVVIVIVPERLFDMKPDEEHGRQLMWILDFWRVPAVNPRDHLRLDS